MLVNITILNSLHPVIHCHFSVAFFFLIQLKHILSFQYHINLRSIYLAHVITAVW